jgi:hypothetical protein
LDSVTCGRKLGIIAYLLSIIDYLKELGMTGLNLFLTGLTGLNGFILAVSG